ncbi:MAG TPA: toll/interleukin-1 receptor domain-containing protein [Thermoanaerobaculia bacterium]|nr:toll/interleukin-1 receptor domain-containing protein [Thermoanaerobaculia bacterium]
METHGGSAKKPGDPPGPSEARDAGPFAYDVFISYAHLDNEPLLEGETGWISDFHAVLEKRLSMLLGEPARIWRDPELRGNQYFDQTIAGGFENAALFLSVLTPRYVRSDYCRKELEGFCRRAQADSVLLPDDRSRILKVVKTPVELPEQPPPMDHLLGYEFFRLDPEKKRLHELQIRSADDRERFLASLEDLAAEIREALRLIKGGRRAPGAAGAAASPESPGQTVYLAPASFDRKEEHELMRRELAARGYTVLPSRPLPLEAEELDRSVRQDLARCDLSIHILGARYGLIPEGADRSAVEIQIELAAPLRRIFWVPPGLVPQDARQQALLDRLRTDPEALGHASFLETSLEELKAFSLDRLDQMRKEAAKEVEKEKAAATSAAPAPGTAAAEEGPRWVYLLHTPRDTDEVTPWVDFLWEQGFEVRTPLFEGSEGEIREEHESNLQVCDGFLLYFGQGNERWLRKMLLDLKKAQGLGRTRPILSKGIWMAPPDSPEKARFRTLEAVLLTGSAPSEEALRPFLAPLVRS